MLGNPDFIQAGFDSDAMVIGIRASDEADDKKVYRFRERVKNGWVRIGCKDFVKYLSELLRTSFSPSKRYIAKYDESRKILYIELYGKDVKSQNEDKEDTTA